MRFQSSSEFGALFQKPGRTATLPVISPDFSNLEACLDATIEADINQDGIIQEYEYPDFLTSLGDDIIDHRNYDDLPITAKLNFMYLSCWCGKNISCCKGIWISPICLSSYSTAQYAHFLVIHRERKRHHR